MASTVITYILWLFFGWTGLHHVYLGRLNQAIVWFATLGGGCGLGWIRDFWKIPDYLEWCNADKSTQTKHIYRSGRSPRRGCSYFRFAGMVIMGFLTSTFLGALVPDFKGMLETQPLTYYFLRYTFLGLLIFGNGLGVYLVANIGELQCDKYYPFMASLVLTLFLTDTSSNMGSTSFITAAITWYFGLRWRPLVLEQEKKQKTKLKFCKNMTCYLVACTLWLGVFTAGIYFNGTITSENGQKVPVYEAVHNFFKSDIWKQTKSSLYHIFSKLYHSGPRHAWNDAKSLFDFSGEKNAYRVLNLTSEANQDEISKRCRKMYAENHPDRYRSQTEKDAAQEKFIEIQQACTILTTARSRYKKMSRDE